MNWTILTALGSWIPTTAIVGFLLQYQKRGFDRSLEQIKRDLQTDVVRFSKWHEKRVTALEVIYQAFSDHLDFLRRKFYFDSEEPIDSIHDFPRTLQAQMLYLDAATAAKISIYQGELLQFWSQVVQSRNDTVAKAQIRDRLDHEIPGYLPKLQRDINQALDPDYDPECDAVRKAIIDFYFSDRRASPPP
jgi:hypothetical protein